MSQKRAFVTGISGQDGSYLSELLIKKGYEVVGLLRHTAAGQPDALQHLHGNVEYVFGNLLDTPSLAETIRKHRPDEIYHLASQSYPAESWRLAIETGEITGLGAHRLFEAVRQVRPQCRIYQASSSEMYGEPEEIPQSENTPFKPVNPYAAAKLYAHNIARIYAESYGMFIAIGILFNHESPRRGMYFLTQKVAYGAACIKLGIENSTLLNEQGEPIVQNSQIALGNLDAKRDWGFAGDYVEAMWLMLQQATPGVFVVGTGQVRTVRQFCEAAFSCVGRDWKKHVRVDPRFVRPIETGPTVADASKARSLLGWEPKTAFSDMVAMMVENHVKRLASSEVAKRAAD